MYEDYELNASITFSQITSREPIKCISKSLLELHLKSVIDFSEYTYIKPNTNEMPWYEITIKVVCCMLSISIALFGNLFTVYNMLIKPKLKSGASLKYEYYASNTSGVSIVLNKFSLAKKSNRQESATFNREMRSFSMEKERDSDINNKGNKFFITKVSRPTKRKPVNFFILNLCFCDLMIVIWCSWVHMVNSVKENWIMGELFCKGSSYVQSKLNLA